MSDWDTYFMKLARVTSEKSSCLTRQIGAIIVKDHHIISSGYNGTVSGALNCNTGGCPRCTQRVQGSLKSGEGIESCLCAHAETNAVVLAARHGISTDRATMYCWCPIPCTGCSKVIANSGIVRIVCLKAPAYDEWGKEILSSAGIQIELVPAPL